MTMRKRVLSIRLSDQEYQSLKSMAAEAGISAPVLARRLALESVQLAPRLDSLERQIRDIPSKAVLLEVVQRLSKKIDTVAGKGVSP